MGPRDRSTFNDRQPVEKIYGGEHNSVSCKFIADFKWYSETMFVSVTNFEWCVRLMRT